MKFALFSILSVLCSLNAGELRFAGSLGNSGGSGETRVTFGGDLAPGMGPVLDDDTTLWERGGSRQLNRYALDGRQLASFEIPESTDRSDQLTRAGNLLVLKLGKLIYRMPLDAAPGTKPERLDGTAEVMSAGGFKGRVVVYQKDEDELSWLDPATGDRMSLVKPGFGVTGLEVDKSGTVYAFGDGKVFAWKDGKLCAGYPFEFRGERPQKIGKYWHSHSWHGTINRMNEKFEPKPGVVLGGASGSFIGYLPQSADITNGRGLVHLRGDLYAVSGLGGVVQLLQWNGDELRFEVVRRIGALRDLAAVALDADGNIWTPRGSWRWDDTPESPNTLGDKEPELVAQPVVIGGKTLCLLKKHYQYVQLGRGPLIDENGWSHLETRGIDDLELPESVTGAAAIPGENGLTMIVVERGGKAFEFGIIDDGSLRSQPKPVTIPGLRACTSLAWFEGRLLAADSGVVLVFERDGDAWKAAPELARFEGEIFIHSDGKRLAVSDTAGGALHLYDSLTGKPATLADLDAPRHVAVSGDRVVVYESGKQRLTRLKVGPASRRSFQPPRHLTGGTPVSPPFTESDFQDLSRPGGLFAAVAIREGNGGLAVSIQSDAEVETLGVANYSGAFVLDGSDECFLPDFKPDGLHLAFTLTAQNQRERFGFQDHEAIHASFSEDPDTWAPFDLDAYRDFVSERKQEIRITFQQPVEGKATMVIENKSGRRVRNLVSGRSFSAGEQTVIWDGLDETGKLVEPGKYRWRAIAHPGVEPIYKMNFANGGEATTAPWGPNHSTFRDAAGNGKLVFFAAPVTEGGWALVALDADGNFVQGYEHQHGLGIQHDAIAADDRHLYCAQDGFIWGGTKDVDLRRDDWKATWTLTVVRYDIESGKLVKFPGKQRALEADTMEVGPGSNHSDLKDFNLGGLVVKDGRLYVGSRDEKAVLVFDAESGAKLDAIPVSGVRHLAEGDEIYAATDTGVIRLRDGRRLFEAGEMELNGLAVAPNGDLLVSDGASHQVHRFTAGGEPVNRVGSPGGPYRGTYEPGRMVNPAGLVFGPDGKLWVTENRWNPKRLLAWDLERNQVVLEKFGMPHYGGDGSGFDPENPRRWIGLGCFWDVDIEAGSARPTHILSLAEGHFGTYEPQSYHYFRENGRTFVCARGKITLISEVRPDGTLHDLVATAGTHHFGYGCQWEPPRAYIDAFYEKWPEKRADEHPGRKGEGKPWSQRGMGVLWVDRNGDGVAQKEEFDFCGDEIDYAGSAWGHLQTSLTLRVPVVVDEQVKIVALEPKSFLENGVPDYPTLDEAIAAALPIDLTPGHKRSGVATAPDRFGRFIFNSDPEMNAFDGDGKPLWTYPNEWSDVHGSHKAPLPEPGVMQGTMAILGIAPLDGESDVFFLNGNHGRCFVLSSDGFYLDEAFVDVRVSYLKNEYRLGGEIFGGSFNRSEKDGKYYVQIGHGPYRIYELAGLNQTRRLSGDVEVTGEQIAAAERKSLRQIAEKQAERAATIPGSVRWDKNGRFPVEVDLSATETHLRLTYRVQDRSPWINNGRDWTRLFSTGDTVDFQFATNSEADPGRRSPVAGDKRLSIAPFEGKPVAVLYEYRKPGGENPIEFTSPWRGEKVDNVTQLPAVEIQVKTSDSGYEVKAAVPLFDLGLELKPGQPSRVDFGVTYGDAGGTDTNLRSHWSNQSTGLVDDIPGEIMLSPNLWGTLTVEGGPDSR